MRFSLPFLLLSVTVLAQTDFRHALSGLTLRLPAGWQAREQAEGVLLLPRGVVFDPAREDNPEVYIAVLRDDYDPALEKTAIGQMSAAFTQGGAASTTGRQGEREAAAFGTRAGSIYRWDLRDPRNGRSMGFDIYLAPEGRRAWALIAIGEQAKVWAREAELRAVLASAGLAASKPPVAGAPLADATPGAQRWLGKLRGKMIRQFNASQGMSSDKRHWLRFDGTYAYKSNSMVSVEVPGASGLSTGANEAAGRWRIREEAGRVWLEVQYKEGRVARMPISEDGRNWYLNGEKAFAVDPE